MGSLKQRREICQRHGKTTKDFDKALVSVKKMTLLDLAFSNPTGFRREVAEWFLKHHR